MNNFQRVLRNTSYLFISEVFLKALGFLWIILLARTLSVELFGRYNLVNSFISVFSFLPDLGVGLVVIREIAKQKDKANIYIGSSFIINTVLAILTIFIILVSIFLLHYPREVQGLIFIASITLFFSTIRSVAVFYFDGIENMKVSAYLNSLNSSFMLAFGFIAVVLGFGLQGIFIGMLIGTLFSLGVSWKKMFIYVIPSLAFNRNQIKHIFTEGLPLGVASFAALIYTEIDAIILNQMLGEKAVGIYSTATPFTGALIQLLNVPFVVALYPALSRLSHEDPKRFIVATKKSLVTIALWSFPVAFLVSAFAWILPYVFGEKYQASVPILQLLIYFVPFASLSALLYKVLIVIKKQQLYLIISMGGAIINVLVNILLIPIFGILGAAIASVGTQVVLFLIYFWTVHYHLKKL